MPTFPTLHSKKQTSVLECMYMLMGCNIFAFYIKATMRAGVRQGGGEIYIRLVRIFCALMCHPGLAEIPAPGGS